MTLLDRTASRNDRQQDDSEGGSDMQHRATGRIGILGRYRKDAACVHRAHAIFN